MTTRSIVLFSGGLDSILACAILAGQGLDVLAVMFTSPFFGTQPTERAEDEKRRMLERYGIRQRENDRLRGLAREDECIVSLTGGSGPCGLWKRMKDPGLCASVASIVASRQGGSPGPTTVLFSGKVSCAVPVPGRHTVSSGLTMNAHNSMQGDLHHA